MSSDEVLFISDDNVGVTNSAAELGQGLEGDDETREVECLSDERVAPACVAFDRIAGPAETFGEAVGKGDTGRDDDDAEVGVATQKVDERLSFAEATESDEQQNGFFFRFEIGERPAPGFVVDLNLDGLISSRQFKGAADESGGVAGVADELAPGARGGVIGVLREEGIE